MSNSALEESYGSSKRQIELEDFCRDNGLKFKDISLLELAFHHRSAFIEARVETSNNERLEFLGDSVLGMVTASYLYTKLKDRHEGQLAKIKSVVVSEHILSSVARGMGVAKYLLLGRGEELSGGRKKNTILADALEAIIGAYFLDSGYEAARKFVLSFIRDEVDRVLSNEGDKDYKTLLQEYYQKLVKGCPTYELVRTVGPDHEHIFWVTVTLGNKTYGPEKGRSKKEAEQNVARKAWDLIFTKK